MPSTHFADVIKVTILIGFLERFPSCVSVHIGNFGLVNHALCSAFGSWVSFGHCQLKRFVEELSQLTFFFAIITFNWRLIRALGSRVALLLANTASAGENAWVWAVGF